MGILDKFRLDGSTALVTGSTQGIGQAIAIALAEAGADIVGVGLEMSGPGSDTARGVQAAGRKFTAYQCDFSDRKALYAFITEVKKNHRIDILVNNAGTIRRAPCADHSDEDWDLVVRVNQDAPFLLTRELGRDMVERGRGKIIFTASLLSFQGGLTVPGYSASKSAVAALAKAFANEWAGCGVCVNAIAPGYIATENTAPLRRDPVRSADILKRIPAGRWGDPQDLQGAAVYLASPASDYVHGSIVLVDGGWMGR
jgi:2-deoxy-D-gluconate 3-dehydrogenase